MEKNTKKDLLKHTPRVEVVVLVLVTVCRRRGTRSLIVNNDLVISKEKYIKKAYLWLRLEPRSFSRRSVDVDVGDRSSSSWYL